MNSSAKDGRLRVGDVISQAIFENRFAERLLYIFAVLFVIAGLLVLVWGMLQGTFVALAGVLESVLFVPAVELARRIREQNLALRLLEIPLRKTRSADEAAQVLTRFFGTAFAIGNPAQESDSRGKAQ